MSTEVFEGAPGGDENGTVNTATFTEADERTTLTVLVQAPSREIRDMIVDSGMEAGMQDAMDLLEEVAVSWAETRRRRAVPATTRGHRSWSESA